MPASGMPGPERAKVHMGGCTLQHGFGQSPFFHALLHDATAALPLPLGCRSATEFAECGRRAPGPASECPAGD